ncbi:ADP-ribosyl-(dinitrogen reductase) hydrolase [Achromobacter sp. AGC78]
MLLNNIVIVPEIRHKLETKHQVREIEVHQCFLNRDGPYVEDTEEEHATDSGYPTEWFVAETDKGRLLKVCFVFENGNVYVKSAYDANEKSIALYEQKRDAAG